MKLYLARHAEAVSEGNHVASDALRFLSPAGRVDAVATGRALATTDRPTHVITSPLVRSVQTAELLLRGLDEELPVETCAALAPNGNLSDLLDTLAHLPADASVLAVGHEPQMSGWTAVLLGRPAPRPFRPGTIVRLDFTGHAEPGAGHAGLHLSRGAVEPLE